VFQVLSLCGQGLPLFLQGLALLGLNPAPGFQRNGYIFLHLVQIVQQYPFQFGHGLFPPDFQGFPAPQRTCGKNLHAFRQNQIVD
jgi:hypothetical protein